MQSILPELKNFSRNMYDCSSAKKDAGITIATNPFLLHISKLSSAPTRERLVPTQQIYASAENMAILLTNNHQTHEESLYTSIS